MKMITQSIEYEGNNDYQLRKDLTAWDQEHPIKDSGIDWEFQRLWAVMTDQDAFAFCLKHPEYQGRFTQV